MTAPSRSLLSEPQERFDPEAPGGTLLAAEHLVRYRWAATAAAEADVLDAACGVGYGTQLLARAAAKSATGVDLSEQAVATARERYGEEASFLVADAAELPLDTDSIDLAVCFETIEHVERPERVFTELRRVLRPGGVLLVSSPNRGVSPPHNPHHVREYTRDELAAELAASFPHVELLAQQPWFAAVVAPSHGVGELALAVRADEALTPGEETYVVAVAADQPAPALERGAAALFAPRGPTSVYEELRYEQRQAHLEAKRADRAEAEAQRLAADLGAARWANASIQSSPSWRLTAPLRAAKRVLGR